MTEEDLPFERRSIPENNQEQKKTKKTSKDYSATQNAKRGYLAVVKQLILQANEIKRKKGFRNDSQVLEYLLDLEKSIREKNLVQEYSACKVCGEKINVELPDNTNITHVKADMKSTCIGCKTTKYRLKTEHSGTNDAKDKKSGTNDAKDKKSGTKDAKSEQSEVKEEVESLISF